MAGTPELELPRSFTQAHLARVMGGIFSENMRNRYQNTISNIISPYSSDLHIILVKYLNFQPPISKDNVSEEQH